MKTRKNYNFKKKKTSRNIKRIRTIRKRRRGGGVSIPALSAIMAGTGVLSGLNYFLMRRRKSKRLKSKPIYEEAAPPPNAVYEDDPILPVKPLGARKGKWLRDEYEPQLHYRNKEINRKARVKARERLEREPNEEDVNYELIIQRLKFNIKSMLKKEHIKYEKELRKFQEELQQLQSLSPEEMNMDRFQIVNKNVVILLTILDEDLPMCKFIIENLDRMLVETHTPGWWWCVWSRLVGWQGQRRAEREPTETTCEKMNLSERILPDGIKMVRGESYPISRFYVKDDNILKYWNNYMDIIYKTFEKIDYTGNGLNYSKKILKGLISNVLPEEEEGRDPQLAGPI